MQPHALPILKMLMQRLHDHANQYEVVTASVLSTLGELSLVAGPLLAPYLDKLMPVVISKLQSSSSSEHMLTVALHTLKKLVGSTGYVVRPYFEYPHLMPTVLGIGWPSAELCEAITPLPPAAANARHGASHHSRSVRSESSAAPPLSPPCAAPYAT